MVVQKINQLAMATCLSAAFVPLSWAGNVRVENYGNEDVYVCHAYETGKHIAQGWTQIRPNQTHTFDLPNDVDSHLRITHGGREYTFQNHQSFLNFPTHPSRFTVTKEQDDNSIRTLRWGENLENIHNMRQGQPLPQGWSSERYFHVGSGNLKLEIRP